MGIGCYVRLRLLGDGDYVRDRDSSLRKLVRGVHLAATEASSILNVVSCASMQEWVNSMFGFVLVLS